MIIARLSPKGDLVISLDPTQEGRDRIELTVPQTIEGLRVICNILREEQKAREVQQKRLFATPAVPTQRMVEAFIEAQKPAAEKLKAVVKRKPAREELYIELEL